MYEAILIIHVVISAALIAMVLLQQGKGSGMGALGGGGSGTLFGSQGSANFMTRTTAMLATGFFITSLTLSYLAIKQVKAARQESIPVPASTRVISDVPAVEAPPAQETSDIPAVQGESAGQSESVPAAQSPTDLPNN